jgi:hypothetical protein
VDVIANCQVDHVRGPVPKKTGMSAVMIDRAGTASGAVHWAR